MRTNKRFQVITPLLLLAFCAGVAALGVPGALSGVEADLRAQNEVTQAVASSAAIAIDTGAFEGLPAAMQSIMQGHPEVVAVEIVPQDGQPFGLGAMDALHTNLVSRAPTAHRVTLVRSGKAWGVVNVLFRPTARGLTLASGLPWYAVLGVVLVLPVLIAVVEGVRRRRDRTAQGPMALGAERAQHTLDTLAEGVLLLDGECRVVFANTAFSELVGSTAAALTGKPVGDLPWSVRAAGEDGRPWEVVLRSSQPVRGARLDLEHGGESFTFMVNCTPLFAKPGSLHGILLTLDDVTELERSRVTIQEARDSAQHANEAKSRFLAMMSHEIRTPLNGVCGTLQLLKKTPLEKNQSQYIDAASFSASTLLHLINDVLDLSKIEAGQMELSPIDFELEECVDRTMLMMAQTARAKGLALAYEIGADVAPRFTADPDRIRQVIINLTNNAVKFTAQGSVSLRVSVAQDTPQRQTLRCDITDTGIGIPPDKLHRLFKAFSQVDSSTSRKYGGTGLGLVISKQLCEAMGGRIDVASTPGQGTTFTFMLDLAKAAQVASGAAPVSCGCERAVLVGLHELEMRAVRRSLGLEDNRVTVAPDLDAVLPLLQAKPAESGNSTVVIVAAADEASAAHAVRKLHQVIPGEGVRILVASLVHDIALPDDAGVHDATILRPIGCSRLLQTLRKKERAARSPGHAEVTGNSHDLTGLNVLLAEDNLVGQMVVADMLRGWGAHCDVAGNGNEVLTAVARQPYDVVLMDCFMPELDGFETTRRIRELQKQGKLPARFPIIALTAKAMRGDRDACMEAGMDGYVAKPVDQEELLRAVVQHTAGRPMAEGAAASTPHATAPPGIDVASLRQRYDSKPALLRQLAEAFRSTSSQDLDRIEKAIEASDAHLLEHAAHRLAGGAGFVSADGVRVLAAELESRGANHQLDQLQAMSEQLKREVAQALLEIEKVLTLDGEGSEAPNVGKEITQ